MMVAADVKSRSLLLRLGALALVVWGCAAWLLWPSQDDLLNWDEVDYVNAARLGAWSNMIERGSIGTADFLAFARSKYERREPSYPNGYDEERDPLLLRHFHPPLVVLMLSGLSASRSERVLRTVQLAGTFCLIAAILVSYGSLTGAPSWAGVVVVSLSALWMSLALFGTLSFHGWAAVWITTSAAWLGHWLEERRRSVGIILCVSLALALLTLETGLIVWGAVLLCLSIWRSPLPAGGGRSRWRSFAVGIALIAAIVLVAWPGAVVKASLLKIPALYLYRIWLGEEYDSASFDVPGLVRSLLPAIVLGVMAFSLLSLVGRSDVRRWGPLLIVGGIDAAALARFALAPTYVLAAFGPLACAVGLAADRIRSTAGRAIVVGIALLTVGVSWPVGIKAEADRAHRDDLRSLKDLLRGREALMDGGHRFLYYLGPGYTISPITVSHGQNTLTKRECGAYRSLRPKEVEGKVIVIQKNRRRFPRGTTGHTLIAQGSVRELRTLLLYDCNTAPRTSNRR